MRNVRSTILVVAPVIFLGAISLGGAVMSAQPEPRMTFFVTSKGRGFGADLGGLTGADAYCLRLATSVGEANHVWRAYLSAPSENGRPAVNARDRIGRGPWVNARGVEIASSE